MTKAYIKMRPNELHNALVKHIPEPEMRELKKAEIEHAKKTQRAERLRNFQHKRLWNELLSPLRYELSNARVGLRHKTDDVAREQAFSAYIRLMTKLEKKLEALQLALDDDGRLMTPSHIAKELSIPNNGVHWTDWIPLTKRTEVEVLFGAIPHKPKAKRKLPFQRTQRPNTKLKTRLLKRTIKELGNLESERAIDSTGVALERITQIKRAIKLIEALKPTDAVPHTWHGLIKQPE